MYRTVCRGLFLLAFTVGPTHAADIDAPIQSALPHLIELRHDIHQHPELSNRETRTSALVAQQMRALGLDVRTGIAHTGVIALIHGGQPGPVVAVRADMDALPVTEETDFPFRSTVRTQYDGQEVGVAHACGHDVHTTVAVGVATVLAGMRKTMPGTVIMIFQPAEEGVPKGEEGGAKMMLAQGLFEQTRPDAIFALHTGPELPIGQVGFGSGPVYASSDRFRVTLHGKQAHGAHPDQSVDPVVLASQVVLDFQTIVSRTIDPIEPAVVSVGIVRGGERFNIIPADVYLEGTVRAFNAAVQDTVEARMRAILDGLTSAAGARYDFEYERMNPPVYNDPPLSAWARDSLVHTLGAEAVVDIPPTMGAEDFAWFAKEVPGFYFRLGTVEAGTTSGGWHTPTFRAGDGAIEVGVKAMTGLVLDYLNSGGPSR
jgi:amidohydrolase